MKMISSLRNMVRDQRGQSLTEYALILAVIAIVAVVAMRALGVQISTVFTNVRTWLSGS